MSATERDPFTRWQAGFARIVAAELAGEVVPPKWLAALDALDAECRAIHPPPPLPGIAIGNRKRGDRGVYVGRELGDLPASPLGNPFRIGGATTRERAIAEYATWLDYHLADEDSPQARAFRSLRVAAIVGPLTLVCWCVTRADDDRRDPARYECHAEVIRARLLAQLGQPTIEDQRRAQRARQARLGGVR